MMLLVVCAVSQCMEWERACNRRGKQDGDLGNHPSLLISAAARFPRPHHPAARILRARTT